MPFRRALNEFCAVWWSWMFVTAGQFGRAAVEFSSDARLDHSPDFGRRSSGDGGLVSEPAIGRFRRSTLRVLTGLAARFAARCLPESVPWSRPWR